MFVVRPFPLHAFQSQTIHINVRRRRRLQNRPKTSNSILMTFFRLHVVPLAPCKSLAAFHKCKYDWLRFVTFEIDIGRIKQAGAFFFSTRPTSSAVFTVHTHTHINLIAPSPPDSFEVVREKIIPSSIPFGATLTLARLRKKGAKRWRICLPKRKRSVF